MGSIGDIIARCLMLFDSKVYSNRYPILKFMTAVSKDGNSCMGEVRESRFAGSIER